MKLRAILIDISLVLAVVAGCHCVCSGDETIEVTPDGGVTTVVLEPTSNPNRFKFSAKSQRGADDDLQPVPDPISTPQIILPMTPVLVEPDAPEPPKPVEPTVISTIKADEWYVIESQIELITLQSPDALLTIDVDTGPITLRGKFADGTGKVERRKYTSPFVYSVSGEKPGKTELILIPVGVEDAKHIVRQVLTVSGQGPNPPPIPPDPGPDPDPIPPGPVTSFRVIFVKESGDTLNAAQSAIPGAKVLRDYLTAKTTPEGGLAGWREYDPDQNTTNEQPTMKALWTSVKPTIQPVPCVVIERNGKADILPLPANVDEALKLLKTYGGN